MIFWGEQWSSSHTPLYFFWGAAGLLLSLEASICSGYSSLEVVVWVDDHWAGPKEPVGQASVGQTALKKDTEKQPLRSLELIWRSREAQEKTKIETCWSWSGNWCSFLAPYSPVPWSGQTFHYSSRCYMLPWALRRWSEGLKEKGLSFMTSLFSILLFSTCPLGFLSLRPFKTHKRSLTFPNAVFLA